MARGGPPTGPAPHAPPGSARRAARAASATTVSLLAALALAAWLPGCGGGPEPVVLSVGGAPRELVFWERLAADFADSTGIAVEVQRRPADTDQQRQALVVALAAGRPDPDVFLMDVAWLGLFAAAGWLAPLAEPDSSAFFPRIIDQVDRHGGEVVALPVYLDVGLLYYRRDLLRRFGIPGPPRTWEELRRMAARVQPAMRREDPRFFGFVWQGAQYEGLVVDWMEFAGADGGFLPARPGPGFRLDVPANRRALAFMRDLIARWRLSPPSTYTEMREEQVRRYFQQGHALFERNWPYAWAAHQAPGSPVAGEVGVAMLPGPEGSRPAPTLGGWHVGVNRRSDRPRRARRLVAYLTSRPVQRRMMLELGWNPGRADLYDDPEILDRAPRMRTLARSLARARPRPLVPYYPQISAVVQRRLSAALAGDQEPGAALAAAGRRTRELAARYSPPPEDRP